MHCIGVSKNKIKETVKLQQKKYRDSSGLFIAEGFNAVEELIGENIEILDIYALKNSDISKIGRPAVIIDETLMKKLSTTSSTCEILAVAKKKKRDIKSFIDLKKLILLDSISDPGNLGTILRSASAFGADGIILFGGCVDIYSPKVIRSASGNLFKTPVIELKNIDELNRYFKNHIKISTVLSKENNISLKECAALDKYILMFGSESQGLSTSLTNLAEKNIKLEMKKNVDSLNLAVCISVILYELFI